MAEISFSRDETKLLVGRLQDYLNDELDTELGNMDAEFLLEFITRELGGVFYNRGLNDAHALFAKRADDLADEIYALEKPTGLDRR